MTVSGPEPSTAPDTTPTMYGLHPHNKYPLSILPLLASDSARFSKTVLAQSSLSKAVPSVGWVNYFSGRVIDVTKGQLLKNLTVAKKSVALFPGGAREMILCEPFQDVIPIVTVSAKKSKLAELSSTRACLY